MSGYIALALFGLLAFAALVMLRLPKMLWTFAGAALFLGAAGYAWQGRPGVPAHDATAATQPIAVEPAMIMLRDRLMGRYTADGAYLIASDAMLRTGDAAAATHVVLGGIRAFPNSFILWTQLGTNLALHDGDQMSPPALAAFRQAIRLAPRHPAPFYYMGLAYVRAGNLPAALPLWKRAAALSAPGSDYGQDIARQLALLDRALRIPPRGPDAR
ncbi:MAG: hypothetical protein P0Y64_00890 [Candidatus Sphingomonas colombiensis]|nr:hypothetical protein [Sphingomonas sp.]WEK43433.1 MAG: hypothetical protein P0Y64_00890 [Sphingomonas sp.]